MNTTSRLFLISSLLTTTTACVATSDSTDDELQGGDRDRPLVGGDPAGASEFPSTLLLNDMCTAAKVGPRHILTAAHCVHDRVLRPEYQPGATVLLTNAKIVPNDASFLVATPATIAWTYVHPEWLARCTTGLCGYSDPEFMVPADVAVIELADDTPFPASAVDLREVADGEGVVIMGYGCEAGLSAGSGYLSRLKDEHTFAIPGAALNHPGTFVPSTDPRFPRVVGSYFLTPGQAMIGSEASLCPGDSGGPVYRDDGSGKVIVGVNANYSFLPGSDIAYTNWHTRLDGISRSTVGPWLQSLGVQMVLTPASIPCGDLPSEGQCLGDALTYCASGAVQWLDCGPLGMTCGWNPSAGTFDCLAP